MPLQSFSPVAAPGAHTLVLGSMPGKISLQHQQYYAHPRNAFWPIMSSILGFDPQLEYAQRLGMLTAKGYALWDVMQHCERESSLDADIVETSIVANDFAGLFRQYPTIRRVFFNGGKAEQSFKRYVLDDVAELGLAYRRLPSTSPAHAAVSFEEKFLLWEEGLRG